MFIKRASKVEMFSQICGVGASIFMSSAIAFVSLSESVFHVRSNHSHRHGEVPSSAVSHTGRYLGSQTKIRTM